MELSMVAIRNASTIDVLGLGRPNFVLSVANLTALTDLSGKPIKTCKYCSWISWVVWNYLKAIALQSEGEQARD